MSLHGNANAARKNITLTARILALRASVKSAAECAGADTEMFFPAQGDAGKQASKAAKSMCAACPVQVECLDLALACDEPEGIWGGLTTKERVALRVARARTARSAS